VKREKTQSDSLSAWENPEGFLAENFDAARAGMDRSVKDVAAYTQLQPEKALLWAMGGGYLLRMLPLTGILGGIIRLIFVLLKPAAFLYLGAKVWQKARPIIAPRHSGNSSSDGSN